MGVKTLISEEEYLQMTFDGPEPDFVDGEIVDRGMPNLSHSKVARRLGRVLGPVEDRTGACAMPELRVRVSSKRLRVVDLAVFRTMPSKLVPDSPPWIAIEIVSPDDKHDTILRKLSEYQSWGVPHILLIDPPFKSIAVYRDGSLTSVNTFHEPELGITISRSDLFD